MEQKYERKIGQKYEYKKEQKEQEETLKSAGDSYRYARDVLKGRFEKGEDVISKDAMYSYRYQY